MDTRNAPQRLHLRSAEGTVKIDPAFTHPDVAGQCSGGDAELPRDHPGGGAIICELIGSDPDMIELLADRQRNTVSVVEPSPSGGQDSALSALAAGMLGPPVTLHQLQLRGTGKDPENHQEKRELYR
jgi:hypothetical protein